MPRILLLLPSSTYRAADFLAAARDLGVEVVVASDAAFGNSTPATSTPTTSTPATSTPATSTPATGTPATSTPATSTPATGPHPGSDADSGDRPVRSLVVDVDDPAATALAIVELDRISPLDAVVAVDDRGIVAAAVAAERLGLPHAAPDAVVATRDKLRMRIALDSAEVPQPTFVAVDPADEAAAVRAAAQVGYPCVVKPTALSTSRGVIRADGPEALAVAFRRAGAIARAAGEPHDRPLLVEQFVGGPEVAVEGVLRDGVLDVVAVFDKPDPLDGPYFEETIYITPSRLDAADRRAVTATTSAACRALGLRHGPVHAELRVSNGRANVIELAARTVGGLCGRTIEIATGRRLETLVLANALGTAVPRAPRHRAAGVLMLPAPTAGRFAGVDGVDLALAVPGVTGVEITVTPGRYVAPAPDGARYVGFVFAKALTPAEAEAALRTAWARLDVHVDQASADDTELCAPS